MIQTAEITFNLNDIKLPTIICRNEETGRQIQFTLVDESGDPITLPNTATYTFLMIKPDGNFIETTIPAGLLTVSDQLTASGGLGHYAIKITDTDTLIYSGQGGILIDDHLITDDTIDSISEVYGLHFPDDFLTIYSSVAVLDDSSTSALSTWSSSKIAAEIAAGSGADLIDDNATTQTKTWSSDKIATELAGKPDVDDTAQNYSDTWSSEKINSEIQSTTHIADNVIGNNSTWSSQKISDEISAITPGGDAYSTTEHAVGTWVDGSTVYERTYLINQTAPPATYTYNVPFTGCRLIDYIPHYVSYSYQGQTLFITGSELAFNDYAYAKLQYAGEVEPDLVFSSALGSVDSAAYCFTIRYIKP